MDRIIETPRLVLRPHTRADFEDSATMRADPEVMRFIGGKPFNREEAWTRFLRNVGHWEVLGFGYWVVRDAAGRYVGEVGFADFQREVEPHLDGPEAGWVLASWAHGQGFATEAVRAILVWGERHFGSQRPWCIIDPDNAPSIRVAEKCGFVKIADGSYRGAPTLVFACDQPGAITRPAGTAASPGSGGT
jgi:RimJ/RimL family protein N-acetyltransferase